MFKYKLSRFSGKEREKSQIGESCDNSESVTNTSDQQPLPPYISILNNNIIQFNVLCECLFHQKTRNITHQGNEHLNWASWLLVWSLLISFLCFDKLCNHLDV